MLAHECLAHDTRTKSTLIAFIMIKMYIFIVYIISESEKI